MTCGGIVLCGGRSRRMGMPKADLPFGPETMLARVVRLLSDVVSPIVVVAAREQELPALAADVQLVRDRQRDRGPLEGLAAGLKALESYVDAAYVTGCDVPLLAPDFVRRVIELSERHDVAVPFTDGYHHPLAAVYRINVLQHIEQLLAAGRMRPVFLFDEVDTCVITADELIDVDPELATLDNLNRPADYFAALSKAGLTAPDDVRARLESI